MSCLIKKFNKFKKDNYPLLLWWKLFELATWALFEPCKCPLTLDVVVVVVDGPTLPLFVDWKLLYSLEHRLLTLLLFDEEVDVDETLDEIDNGGVKLNATLPEPLLNDEAAAAAARATKFCWLCWCWLKPLPKDVVCRWDKGDRDDEDELDDDEDEPPVDAPPNEYPLLFIVSLLICDWQFKALWLCVV